MIQYGPPSMAPRRPRSSAFRGRKFSPPCPFAPVIEEFVLVPTRWPTVARPRSDRTVGRTQWRLKVALPRLCGGPGMESWDIRQVVNVGKATGNREWRERPLVRRGRRQRTRFTTRNKSARPDAVGGVSTYEDRVFVTG